REMLAFRQGHPNFLLNSDSKGDVRLTQFQKLSDELNKVRLEVIDAKAVYESAQAMANDPARVEQWLQQQQQTTADNTPMLAESQRLELEVATLRQSLLPSHPRVKA